MFATFTAGRGEPDIRVALIDRPEMLECVLDEDGPGLDLIVLGEAELDSLAGYPVREPCEAVAAIERLRDFGPEAVLASLGPGGVVLVDGSGAFHAETEIGPGERPLDAASVDALLAGFLTAGARGPEALAAALLSAATGPGGAVGTGGGTPGPIQGTPGPTHRTPIHPTVHVTWIDALEVSRACIPS